MVDGRWSMVEIQLTLRFTTPPLITDDERLTTDD
jgi:hypothetical protein